jgi:hypothetical protein
MPSIFRTLRFRIAAAFFLWTGLIQVALFVGLPVARDAYVIDAVDTRLQHVADTLKRAAREGAAPAELVSATGVRSADPSAVQVRVEDGNGTVPPPAAGQEPLWSAR